MQNNYFILYEKIPMSLRITHLNCSSMCPIGGWLASGSLSGKAELFCHCLLIETNEGLVLTDTGIGIRSMRRPDYYLGTVFMHTIRPKLDEAEAAVSQILRLGYKPSDVRHIVLTHLDPDHAGGIGDFPKAKIHVFEKEHSSAMSPNGIMQTQRYMQTLWEHKPDWEIYRSSEGETWKGFECVRNLKGLPPEIIAVPLHGHTQGHCAVAVETGTDTVLHAGDAYFHYKEMHEERSCPPALELLQTLMEVNRQERLHNQKRLRDLIKRERDVRLTCAHDPFEFRQFRERNDAAV